MSCLKERDEAVQIALKTHEAYRRGIGLPPRPPKGGPCKCRLCVNECEIPEGGVGFCGVMSCRNGRLEPIMGWDKIIVHAYLDPLPTNCVATPVCPGGTGCGYPRYAVSKGPEYGMYNLAVFFAGCNLDCLFCQNWEHKNIIVDQKMRLEYAMSWEKLVEQALKSRRITCVCYFGGDPGPHIVQALRISRRIIEEAKRRGLIKRICWETNGLENPGIMREMARLSLISGGVVKIDFKAWSPRIYEALTGVDGERAVRRVMENVRLIAEMGLERPDVPLLVVSTLLVPGYVGPDEVEGIAQFLASIDEDIPYVLLAFHPDHLMRDLPPTSIKHAQEALERAKKAGLKRVFLGNEWLLGPYY